MSFPTIIDPSSAGNFTECVTTHFDFMFEVSHVGALHFFLHSFITSSILIIPSRSILYQ